MKYTTQHHFPLTDRVLIWAASNWFITVSVQSDLLVICICSCSVVLHHCFSATSDHQALNVVRRVRLTVGFVFLWEYSAIADLIRGGAQVVMPAMGSGYNCRWSFIYLPAAHLPLCSWFLIGHRWYPGVGGPCYTGNTNDKTWKGKCDSKIYIFLREHLLHW